ncbi:hypothetical protein RJ639_028582 [Escallonia herrerae]|uniref:Dehydrin n=1 Tax=Escallonia herrerae TaxID=1293975 RepID=A0AA88XAW2_9ASTE|nr:hypothetical protein RJ639_028582 [Escallonia herrerae]
MAEEHQKGEYEGGETEVKDRGLFDFMGKKEEEKKPCEEQVIVSEFEKVQVSDPEPAKIKEEEGEKKHGLLEKLHRSGSSSSSSSSDEEEVEGEKKEKKKKKKKGLKEKIKEKVSGGDEHKEEEKEEKYEDTSVPVEKYEEVVPPQAEPEVPAEEKKGFLDKIKDKLPGGHKKQAEEVVVVTAPPPPPPVAAAECASPEAEAKEKKGILEKIKEKLPGYHPKSTEEEKEKEEKEKC